MVGWPRKDVAVGSQDLEIGDDAGNVFASYFEEAYDAQVENA
jgi:hypothetical protein